jgi:hypothetical protein
VVRELQVTGWYSRGLEPLLRASLTPADGGPVSTAYLGGD